MSKKVLSSDHLIVILIVVLPLLNGIHSQQRTDNNLKPEDSLKTLSRSKASVWVDTNKGNIYSTSIGSSHLEKDKNKAGTDSINGRSSNMLLTLLVQPASSNPVSQVNSTGNESSLKPILLLLQQQQDLSELLLEKQEKLEKMNVHLQQQAKHQHLLMVELLEQIKMFLEIVNSPNIQANRQSSTDEIDRLMQKYTRPTANVNDQANTAISSANAMVTAPKTKELEAIRLKPIGTGGTDDTKQTPDDSNESAIAAERKARIEKIKMWKDKKWPILAVSNSQTIGRAIVK